MGNLKLLCVDCHREVHSKNPLLARQLRELRMLM